MRIGKIFEMGCLGYFIFIAVVSLIFLGILMTQGNEPSSQPFEVVTKKGTVKLHLGMPRDSVIMLVGKPDYIKSHSQYGRDIIEELGYSINSDYSDLNFTFENGKLKEFRQN